MSCLRAAPLSSHLPRSLEQSFYIISRPINFKANSVGSYYAKRYYVRWPSLEQNDNTQLCVCVVGGGPTCHTLRRSFIFNNFKSENSSLARAKASEAKRKKHVLNEIETENFSFSPASWLMLQPTHAKRQQEVRANEEKE